MSTVALEIDNNTNNNKSLMSPTTGTTPNESRRSSVLKQKRGSIMWNNVARKSIMMSRQSIWNLNVDRKIANIKYENTFQLEAKDDEKFLSYKAKEILEEELKKMLENYIYDIETINEKTRMVVDILKKKIKELPCTRYKLVVMLTIIQAGSQTVCYASRAVWHDKSGDNMADVVYRNASLMAIATVYGIYYE